MVRAFLEILSVIGLARVIRLALVFSRPGFDRLNQRRGNLRQPLLAGLAFAGFPGAGGLGIEQSAGFVQAGLDESGRHGARRGVQDQVSHAEVPCQRPLVQRHRLRALMGNNNQLPPQAAGTEQQRRVRGGEAVAAPAHWSQQPNAARTGDEPAVGLPCPGRLPGGRLP
jgi:hypothetical protein